MARTSTILVGSVAAALALAGGRVSGQGGQGARTPPKVSQESPGTADTRAPAATTVPAATPVTTTASRTKGTPVVPTRSPAPAPPRSAAAAPAPPAPVDSAALQAAAALVAQYVRGHDRELQFCYEEQGLKTNPDLVGEVTLSLQLTRDGAVSVAAVSTRAWTGDDGEGERVEGCVLSRVKRWRFPVEALADAGPHLVSYRFER